MKPVLSSLFVLGLSISGAALSSACSSDNGASSPVPADELQKVDAGSEVPDNTAPAPSSSSEPSEEPEPAGCVPEVGTDVPDDKFADSNCDGIDGDAKGAIFVSPDGADSAPGSKESPLESGIL